MLVKLADFIIAFLCSTKLRIHTEKTNEFTETSLTYTHPTESEVNVNYPKTQSIQMNSACRANLLIRMFKFLLSSSFPLTTRLTKAHRRNRQTEPQTV